MVRAIAAIAGTVAATVAPASFSQAQAPGLAAKLCIFAVAQKLPPIPGLVIVASRVKPAPQGTPVPAVGTTNALVEIDVRAAGQDATFSFACATGKETTVATPIGLSR